MPLGGQSPRESRAPDGVTRPPDGLVVARPGKTGPEPSAVVQIYSFNTVVPEIAVLSALAHAASHADLDARTAPVTGPAGFFLVTH